MLLLYSTVDEFVMTNLMNYGGKPLVSAEQAKLNLNSTPAEGAAAEGALDSEAADALRTWMVETVPGVKQVELSSRLVDSTYHLPLTTYHLPLTTYHLLLTTYY